MISCSLEDDSPGFMQGRSKRGCDGVQACSISPIFRYKLACKREWIRSRSAHNTTRCKLYPSPTSGSITSTLYVSAKPLGYDGLRSKNSCRSIVTSTNSDRCQVSQSWISPARRTSCHELHDYSSHSWLLPRAIGLYLHWISSQRFYNLLRAMAIFKATSG